MASFRFCLTIETSKHTNDFKRVAVKFFVRKVTSEKKSKLKIGMRLLPTVAYLQQHQNRCTCQFFCNLIADLSN